MEQVSTDPAVIDKASIEQASSAADPASKRDAPEELGKANRSQLSEPSSTAKPSTQRNIDKPSRSRAAAADVGMVPAFGNDASGSASESAVSESSASGAPVTSTQPLTPQERKAQKRLQRLEKSIAQSIPAGNESLVKGLVTSVIPGSRQGLTITLSKRWYELEPGLQEAIANALWGQRESLNVKQLTLQDPRGKTLARPPVVGDQMIILRR